MVSSNSFIHECSRVSTNHIRAPSCLFVDNQKNLILNHVNYRRYKSMDGVTAIANVLKLEGVDFIGCMPSNPLIEAAAIAGIRPIVFRQERTGVHMADGFARVTNGKRAGIFLMQAGPGAENAFGGVAQAYADSVPILLLPAGAARHRQGIDPVFSPTRSYESITKWAAQINYADRVPELMRHAFTKLRSGKPGPVLLEIPGDLVTEEIGEEQFDYTPPEVIRTAGDPEAVARAARALLSAQRPVITAGQGVLYAEAANQLVELAEYLQIPVMTTLEGKSAFPENHPLSLGIGGSSQTGQVHRFLTGADTVFAVGASMTRSNFTAPLPPGKTLIHTTNADADINKDYRADYPVVGDARLVLTQFLEEIKRQTGDQARPANRELTDEIAASRQEWLDQWLPRLTTDEVPLNPYRVIWEIMHTVDLDNTIVTHESGQPQGAGLALLGVPGAAQLHRLGQVHPAGLQPGPGHGRQAGRPGKTGHQLHGRHGFRHGGPGRGDGGAGEHPHHHGGPEQQHHGHLRRQPYTHRRGPLQHQADGRQLRRHVPRHGRLGRTRNRPRPDSPGHAPRPATQRGRRFRPAGVHNQGGGGVFQVPVRMKSLSGNKACQFFVYLWEGAGWNGAIVYGFAHPSLRLSPV